MKSNLDKRLTQVEKAIERQNNPFIDEDIAILVNVSQGETEDSKLAEKEKELGCKINRKKVLFVCIRGLEEI